jgi:hypothetical protein
MLGDKVLASNKKSNEDADFRTNSHLGSTTEKHEPNEKEIAICKTISSGFKCNFCAIDYLLVNDEVIVLEVNGSPGLEYIQKDYPDRNLTDEIVKYIKDSVIPLKQKEYCVNCIIDGIEYEAKIDTGAYRSSIDRDLAEKLKLLNPDKVLYTRHFRSSLGRDVDRPVVGVTFYLAGKLVRGQVGVAPRGKLKTKFLIGRRDLRGFVVKLKGPKKKKKLVGKTKKI